MEHSKTVYRGGSWAALVAAAFVLMISVNALANILPIGGQTTGAISDRYVSMFTPAGFTFSIWGVIYSGLLAFVIVQALPRFRQDASLARMDMPFVLNGLFNAAWIVAWHYEQLALSMVIMLGLLGTLIVLHREAQGQSGLLWKLAVLYPVSVYFAWVCMATLANISILQSAWGWNDALMDEQIWTFLKLAIALTVTAFVYLRYRNVAFVIVVAWASWGIQANQPEDSLVQTAALVCFFLCVAAVGVHIVGRVMGVAAFDHSQTTYE
jgi:benzodiazapine receptor